jgi:hypothetical protein
MFLNNDDMQGPLNANNTHNSYLPSIKRGMLENKITNKFPVELSFDISKLIDIINTQKLVDTVKKAQKIVDDGHSKDDLTNASSNELLYYNEMGLVEFGTINEFADVDENFHTVNLGTYALVIGEKQSYCFDHTLYDSFGIYSALAEILQIDKSEFYHSDIGNKSTTFVDVIHIKSYVNPPYKPSTMLEDEDSVMCYLSLSGETTLWTRPSYPLSNTNIYSKALSSTKLTATNRYMLAALTSTVEDSYVLCIQFKKSNEMTFTRLLELANAK